MDANKPIITVGGRRVGEGEPCYIIAEIGTNYNGDVHLAMEMVRQAARCGVDAVKFQIITAERSYSRKSESYPIFKKIELSKEAWREIAALARKEGVDIFATFVNAEDLDEFADLDFPLLKISSSNVTNVGLLKAVASQKKPVLLSTGLSYLKEVEEAVRLLEAEGVRQMALLQCTSLYPVSPRDVNLFAMKTLLSHLPKYPVGFSDHTQGISCAVASVALGGSVIEKHFTLDASLPGPDHFFSAMPEEMAALVKSVRQVEEALGSFEKKPVQGEIPLREKWQRSLVALEEMPAGSVLTLKNIGVKRSPIKGLEPKNLENVLGKKTKVFLHKDDPITMEVV